MSVNNKDFDGMTSLHYAAGHGHIDVITYLLDNGAQLIEDFIGGTALHTAAQMGETEVNFMRRRREPCNDMFIL